MSNFSFIGKMSIYVELIEKNNFKIYLNMSAYANHIGEKSVKENLKSFIIRKVYFKYGELLPKY